MPNNNNLQYIDEFHNNIIDLSPINLLQSGMKFSEYILNNPLTPKGI